MDNQSHPCAACGGSGEIEAMRATPIPDEPTRGHHWRCGTCDGQNTEFDGTCQWCDCLGVECTRWNCDDQRHWPACPVCQGSGQISDRMPVADALADAETLRLAVLDQPLPLDSFDPMPYPDVGAVRCQIDTRLWLPRVFHETARAIEDDSFHAARAAFRAVPGLRGECQ